MTAYLHITSTREIFFWGEKKQKIQFDCRTFQWSTFITSWISTFTRQFQKFLVFFSAMDCKTTLLRGLGNLLEEVRIYSYPPHYSQRILIYLQVQTSWVFLIYLTQLQGHLSRCPSGQAQVPLWFKFSTLILDLRTQKAGVIRWQP